MKGYVDDIQAQTLEKPANRRAGKRNGKSASNMAFHHRN